MSGIADLSSGDPKLIVDVLHQLAQEVEDGCAGIISVQFTIHGSEPPTLLIKFIGTGKHEEDLMPFRINRGA